MGGERVHGRRALHLAFVVGATVAGGCNAVFGIHEGTPRPPCYDPGPSPLLIDDMEDGIDDICNLGGRNGYWYTSGDGTSTTLEPAAGSTFTPTAIPGGRGQSHYAARFSGSGFTDWGAVMGFNLDTHNMMTEPYDASSTNGITFWMKNSVPVVVNFLIPDTLIQSDGGDCVVSATNSNCNSHFSFRITAPSIDWTEYEVPFSALAQEYGGTATWNPKLLLGVQFLVAPGAAFDVWVDDVSFYQLCTGAACVPTCTDPAFPVPCPAVGLYPSACRLPGTDCSATVSWCSDPQTIDDMEDGNNLICPSGGRSGTWYTDADGTEGTLSPAPGAAFIMTPIPGGRGDSRMAARMTASGFTNWAQMSLSLGNTSGTAGPYDASATGGITFWMKTNAPAVGVNLLTSETVPVSRGGLCSDIATTDNCDNSFNFNITSPHSDWFQYYVPYSALYQTDSKPDANGNTVAGSATWDPTSLTNIQFLLYQPTNVELWIDDLSFYDCSNETCLPTCTDPTAVACPALGAVPANCWLAGTDCSTVTSPPETNFTFTSVWGSAPDDVWAVGTGLQGSPPTASPTVVHWDGSVWSSVENVTTHPLWGIWGSSAEDVWAVGDFGTVVRWNGTGWSGSSDDLNDSLNSVWGSGSSDVWAVGANGAIEHWDGATWSAATGVSSKFLYHLWGSGPADVWAVGDGGVIEHWDGTAWSASVSATDSALWGVWGSGPGDVYAVGNTATGEATILHWDGAAWTTVSTPSDGYPNGVWGSGPDDVWVVGDAILHWNGSAWVTVPSPTGQYLTSVWGTGPSDAWIVGAAGTLLHWNGTSWSVAPVAGIQR